MNHKIEDDLLRGLNRQAQRKFLQEVHSSKSKRTQASQSEEEDTGGDMTPEQQTR